jgi:dolichol-phosphate mannosyltransferase
MRTLVVMPTYDEAENLELVIARLRESRPEADVLVADDDSPDGTGKIADRLAADDDHVHVLHRAGKQGLGAAYRAGFAWGLERDYDVLVEMDADGSHQPEELARLVGAVADGADLVIGSRWVDGGAVLNWPRRRRFISRAGTTYARIMLGLSARDTTSGFRAYRRHTLEQIDLAGVASQGYCFQIDMTRRVHAAGLSTVEVPITFVERERGRSKMSGDIVREALWRVTVWGLARLLPRRLSGGPPGPRPHEAGPPSQQASGPGRPTSPSDRPTPRR